MSDYEKLSDGELEEALQSTHRMITATDEYLAFLESGKGLPRDPTARAELIQSHRRMREKLENDIEKLAEAAGKPRHL